MYTGQAGKGAKVLLPLYIFLALFTKGPLGLIIPFFSILVLFVIPKRRKNFFQLFRSSAMVYSCRPVQRVVFRSLLGRGIKLSLQPRFSPNIRPGDGFVSPQGIFLLLFHHDLVCLSPLVVTLYFCSGHRSVEKTIEKQYRKILSDNSCCKFSSPLFIQQ